MIQCARCGRQNQVDSRFCDQCGVIFPPIPPIPPGPPAPSPATREISRFWLALVQTFGSLTLVVFSIYNAATIQAQPWLIALIASIIAGSNGVTNWYFGAKSNPTDSRQSR